MPNILPELIQIQTGRAWYEQWQLADTDGNPEPLHGAVFTGAMREKAGATPYPITIVVEDADNGLIGLSMSLQQIQAMPKTIAHYDIFKDDESTPVAYGPVEFEATMTP